MRVLIIDDEDNLRHILRRMLEQEKHEVVEAPNGRAGLTIFRRQPFDAVITDIIMPEKEGVETIMEMRALKKDVRIVAMSGGGRGMNLDFLKMAKQLGADATLPKPFRKEELLACLTGGSSGRFDGA